MSASARMYSLSIPHISNIDELLRPGVRVLLQTSESATITEEGMFLSEQVLNSGLEFPGRAPLTRPGEQRS